MRGAWLFAFGFAFAIAAPLACHLAESPPLPHCTTGNHVENGICVADAIPASVVRITAADGGTSCTGDAATERPPTVDPDPLHVGAGADFSFQNSDVVDHEVRGADGQVWGTVPAGAYGPVMNIAKVGSWGYHVSTCTKGGTVIVQ